MDEGTPWPGLLDLLERTGAITGTTALLAGLWAFLTNRILTWRQHEQALTTLKEQHARELAARDAELDRAREERAQLRAELVRWQFLAIDSLDRGERALQLAGAPPVPPRLAEKLMAQ